MRCGPEAQKRPARPALQQARPPRVSVDAAAAGERDVSSRGTIEAWRNRPIEGEPPYVYLDDIVLKRSWPGEVRKVWLLVAIGVKHLRGGEGGQDWLERVPQATQIVERCPADHLGCLHLDLPRAPQSPFQGPAWQRCIVHWYRNTHPERDPAAHPRHGRVF